jgi:hypothetical protein
LLMPLEAWPLKPRIVVAWPELATWTLNRALGVPSQIGRYFAVADGWFFQ